MFYLKSPTFSRPPGDHELKGEVGPSAGRTSWAPRRTCCQSTVTSQGYVCGEQEKWHQSVNVIIREIARHRVAVIL